MEGNLASDRGGDVTPAEGAKSNQNRRQNQVGLGRSADEIRGAAIAPSPSAKRNHNLSRWVLFGAATADGWTSDLSPVLSDAMVTSVTSLANSVQPPIAVKLDLRNPHDSLYGFVVRDPKNAASFLRKVIPSEL
jgi:hypothetical protein